ncbi:MAG TPA: C13 family peptidase [Caulobacteraceae bacterium]
MALSATPQAPLAPGEAPGGATWLRTTLGRLAPASPGGIALLWALAAILGIANTVVFPNDEAQLVSSTLYISGTSIFCGLLVAWVLRLGRSTFHLLGALISISLLAGLAEFALKLATPAAYGAYVSGGIAVLLLIATALIIFGYGAARSPWRRAAAIALGIGVSIGAAAMLNMDTTFWRLGAEVRPLLGRQDTSDPAENQPPNIDDDVLWGAQPVLIEKASAALRPRRPGRANVYAMAVAGSGTQALFSREAREALRIAALHFGDGSRGGALLSNGAADLMQSPLATRANIAAIAQAIGEKADHRQDLLYLYLVSHGSQTAELESDLPEYRSVQPISSVATAQALKAAGVARRVIVVSACFSGTWIPALADDDTIVITAAAKDRTSFGCDDTRRFTVFGEAFLGSLSVRNVSLHDAFEDAKRKISAEEGRENVTPSLPQVFVGRNMQALWMGQQDGLPGA